MRVLNTALALVGAIGMMVGTAAVQPAPAAEIEWKMHMVWVPTRQEVVSGTKWVERVNARTGDKFQITLYSGGALGVKDQDMLRILPPGNVIQATMLYPGYVSRDAPELAFALPEGVLGEAEDIVTIMPELDVIFGEAFAKWNVKYLATFVSPDKTINIYCKEPIESLEALREKKLRVWGKTLADTFAKLDVSATIIPQNDMYVALQTGVVDCATYYPGAANTLSLHEVTPYWSYLSPYAVPIPLIVSQSAWDALPADIQGILLEEAHLLAAELNEAFLAGNYELAEGEKFNSLGGQELGDFPEADQAAFTAAARAVWAETTEALGEPSLSNQKTVSEALGN